MGRGTGRGERGRRGRELALEWHGTGKSRRQHCSLNEKRKTIGRAPVGCADDEHRLLGVHAVHLSQQLRQGRIAAGWGQHRGEWNEHWHIERTHGRSMVAARAQRAKRTTAGAPTTRLTPLNISPPLNPSYPHPAPGSARDPPPPAAPSPCFQTPGYLATRAPPHTWFSTRSAAPPASPLLEPRCTAMESSSSKNSTQGADWRACGVRSARRRGKVQRGKMKQGGDDQGAPKVGASGRGTGSRVGASEHTTAKLAWPILPAFCCPCHPPEPPFTLSAAPPLMSKQ